MVDDGLAVEQLTDENDALIVECNQYRLALEAIRGVAEAYSATLGVSITIQTLAEQALSRGTSLWD